jgi:outer membrane protein assembly factor BamB
MDGRERRCGLCGHLNPPVSEFCLECGVLLSSVAASGLARAPQTQFALPDYLLAARERDREERRRRLATETGEGVGFIWTGAIAAVLALWVGGATGIAAPLFTLGLLALLVGFWRLRRDNRNMARAGTATLIVSSVVLGAALVQTLGFTGSEISTPRTGVVTPTATPDPAEIPSVALPGDGIMPMFRGNAHRTGQNPGPAPVERPVVKWKTFVGGESYASPVIGMETVFVATKAGSLIALRLNDGSEKWRAHVGEYVARTTPAITPTTVFVAAGYTLVAVDAESGLERWSVPLRFAGSSSPVVEGDVVYVATQEGHVSAFASDTGEEIWHYRNDNLLFGSPAVGENVVVIADEAGEVSGLDAGTGRELWHETLAGEVFATPAIDRGVTFVATNEPSLVALDLRSGTRLWQRGVGGESSPAADDGVVYLGGNDQALRALDAETGETRWSTPMGYAIRSSATYAGNVVLIGSGPTLAAIDGSDGRTLWTHVTGGEITADIAVVANTVIASSHDGYIYALGEPVRVDAPPPELAIGERGFYLQPVGSTMRWA